MSTEAPGSDPRGLRRSGIPLKILPRTKLGGINENGDNHPISMPLGFFDQTQVTCVQVAHGRYQRNPLLLQTHARCLGPEGFQRMNQFHQ